MKNKFMIATLLGSSVLFIGCEEEDPNPIVSVNNFETTIAENPTMGQSLGTVDATITGANNTGYYFDNENAAGDLSNYVSLNRITGELTISNPDYFDFEQQQTSSSSATVEARNSSDDVAFGSFLITINVTDILELNVQERLDALETPLEIYNEDNTYLDSLYGKTYEGGLIFSFNTDTGNGYVAAPTDQNTSMAWDPETNFVDQIATGAIAYNLGDGATNTTTIVNALTTGSYAAHICNDLVIGSYSDWFLPTVAGLDLMYDNLHVEGMGNFKVAKYWSSEEFDLSTSAALWSSFDRSGGQAGGSTPKNALYGVRAIRAF